jgi:excinuclease UvrABC nuclease subunit
MTFNLATLPDVPYINPNREPRVAGVYFIISQEDECLYIGQSSFIGHRVRNSPIRYLIPGIKECKVRWIAIRDEQSRYALERLMIAKHKPQFNRKIRRVVSDSIEQDTEAILSAIGS